AARSRGDLAQARRVYRRAVRLARADIFADEPYADWCVHERERLRERRLSALRRLAELERLTGGVETACGLLRRAITIDPLREELHRDLIRALWESGNRAGALRHYAECRRLLCEELDVEPGPEIEALRSAIAA